MNATISLPSPRVLALMGGALVLAVLLLVARPLLLGGDSDAAAPVTPVSPQAQTPSTPKPSRPAPKPRVVLLPGLPSQVANKLRYSKVVVVSLHQGNAAPDRSAVVAAATGARAVGAEHLAVNVLREKSARALQAFVGTTPTPTVVVVSRPGRIVNRLEGAASIDAQLVSQAALNAGAKRR